MTNWTSGMKAACIVGREQWKRGFGLYTDTFQWTLFTWKAKGPDFDEVVTVTGVHERGGQLYLSLAEYGRQLYQEEAFVPLEHLEDEMSEVRSIVEPEVVEL